MKRNVQQGFTLIEILLAISISAMAIVAVGATFEATLRAKDTVEDMSSATDAGPRIIALIERDLEGLWTHNIKNNKVFVGRNMDIAGIEADRIDFLTSTDSIAYVLDSRNQAHHPTVSEVGYWLRPHPLYRELMELWRREDPMVDDDILTGGRFQLVTDRLKEFKITYYDTLGYDAEEKFEWDSSLEDKLPRRVQLEFTVEPMRLNRNTGSTLEVDDLDKAEQHYVRHFVFDRRYDQILEPGVAMIPLPPPPPEEQGPGPGAGGGGTGLDGINSFSGTDITQRAGEGRGGDRNGDGARGTRPDAGGSGPGSGPGGGRPPGGSGAGPGSIFGGGGSGGFNLFELLRGSGG